MTRPHSEDIRERCLADAGETVRSIAQVLRTFLRQQVEEAEAANGRHRSRQDRRPQEAKLVGRSRRMAATALRCDRISAPWVIDGLINGEICTLYVEKGTGSELGRERDVVILDTLGSHKGKAARRIIRATEARLFL